jgi:hypothetical protein
MGHVVCASSVGELDLRLVNNCDIMCAWPSWREYKYAMSQTAGTSGALIAIPGESYLYYMGVQLHEGKVF